MLPLGLRYMALGAFFFSVMSLLVKLAGQRLPSQEIVLARSVVMLAICGVAIRARGLPPLGQRHGLLVLRGVFGFGALSCFYYSLVHLPLADATVIQYTNPAWTAVFAIFVLGEGLRRRELGLLGLSLAGVLLVARPGFLAGGGGLDPLAVLVGLSGALLSGAAYVMVRKLGDEHHLVIIGYFAAVSVLGSLPFTLTSWVAPRGLEWLTLTGVGVSTHLGQVYLTKGLKLERAGRATATALVQIVFAAVWGWLFFADLPDVWGWVGGALVVAAVLLLGRVRS